MKKNEISEFISESINQVKQGLPDDCELNGNFDFDISLITKKSNEGKLGIYLVNFDRVTKSEQIHRLRFSITDKRSMKRNIKYAGKILKEIATELPQIEK